MGTGRKTYDPQSWTAITISTEPWRKALFTSAIPSTWACFAQTCACIL